MKNDKRKRLLSEKNTGRGLYKNDLLLISFVLAAALVGVLILSFLRKEGKSVTVSVDGEFFGQYSLMEDISVEIASGENRDRKNILVISDGVAYMEDADCPNHDCVRARAISREGETIICIPNRVVVSVD